MLGGVVVKQFHLAEDLKELNSFLSKAVLAAERESGTSLQQGSWDGDCFFIFTGLCLCDASLLGIPFKQGFVSKGV